MGQQACDFEMLYSRVQQVIGKRGVEKDQVCGRTLPLQCVPTAHAPPGAATQGFQVVFYSFCCDLRAVHELAVGCAPGQCFKAQGAAAREKVETPCPGVSSRSQLNTVSRIRSAVGRRPGTLGTSSFLPRHSPPMMRSRPDFCRAVTLCISASLGRCYYAAYAQWIIASSK